MTTPAMQPTSSACSADDRADFEVTYAKLSCIPNTTDDQAMFWTKEAGRFARVTGMNFRNDREEIGNYRDDTVQRSWEIWQARAAIVPPVVQAPTEWLEHCPITRRPFFMEIDGVPTYGGPFDSYTIPYMEGEPTDLWHDRELSVRHFDHDRGHWVEDQSLSMRVISEDVLFELMDKAEKFDAAPIVATVQSGWKLVPVDLEFGEMRDVLINFAADCSAGKSVLFDDFWRDFLNAAPISTAAEQASEFNRGLEAAANIAWNGPLIQSMGKNPYMTDKCRAMALQIAGNIRDLKSATPADKGNAPVEEVFLPIDDAPHGKTLLLKCEYVRSPGKGYVCVGHYIKKYTVESQKIPTTANTTRVTTRFISKEAGTSISTTGMNIQASPLATTLLAGCRPLNSLPRIKHEYTIE